MAIDQHASCSLDEVEQLLARGEMLAARNALDSIAESAGDQARLAHDVAQMYMRLGQPAIAEGFYARAVELAPDCPAYHYNHSTALIALGRLDSAETALDRVITTQPEDSDAWYNRATLRKQTVERNHVASIEKALRRPTLQLPARVPLLYALAKELEDLGEFEHSFDALTKGAMARRELLSYRVDNDVGIMQDIGAAFTRRVLHANTAACEDARPVFVVGLPRSGTTLVDRILSTHVAIGSHGESTDFAVSLMKLAGQCHGKVDLLERSLHIDPTDLGKAYCTRLVGHREQRVVDKTPANFLYLGLIARALPQASIIYVRRQPMDVCYAMYKTLFRMAYPFSYDQDDLGRYWLAFDDLMRHWQSNLAPGQMLTVDYEELVSEPEQTSRALLQHVGIPWDDKCLDFHHNPLPSLTASAAQVRQPIYSSSVGLWRRHAAGLAPLACQLERNGVRIDAEYAP